MLKIPKFQILKMWVIFSFVVLSGNKMFQEVTLSLSDGHFSDEMIYLLRIWPDKEIIVSCMHKNENALKYLLFLQWIFLQRV